MCISTGEVTFYKCKYFVINSLSFKSLLKDTVINGESTSVHE